MSHEVEIKYRIDDAERQRLVKYFDLAWPMCGSIDLAAATDGAPADVRAFLAEQDLWPGAASADQPALALDLHSWVVYDRYFFDYRHLMFRVRLQVDASRGEVQAEITHKQADAKIGDAVDRMEINLPISGQGVRAGDFESILRLMELMNFRPILVMRKERQYVKLQLGAAAPIQSLLFTLDRVHAAPPDPEESQRAPTLENDRPWQAIGDFVEVEAMSADPRNVDFAGRLVSQWAQRLDRDGRWQKEPAGYFTLATRKLGLQ
ncbi:MAG: CYTH domain-containing protein [Planctomycetota bacterium]